MKDAGGPDTVRPEAWEEIITGGDPGRTEKDGSASSSTKPSGTTGGYPGRKIIGGASRDGASDNTGTQVGDTGNPGPDKGEGTSIGGAEQTDPESGTLRISAGPANDSGITPEIEDEETPLVIKSWGNTSSFKKESTPTSTVAPVKKVKDATPQRKQSLTRKQVIAAHSLLAKLYKDESLMISNDDADDLAEAIMNFTKEMGFVVSGKAAASGQLILTLLAVEVPIILKVMGKRRRPVKGEVNLEPIIPS